MKCLEYQSAYDDVTGSRKVAPFSMHSGSDPCRGSSATLCISWCGVAFCMYFLKMKYVV